MTLSYILLSWAILIACLSIAVFAVSGIAGTLRNHNARKSASQAAALPVGRLLLFGTVLVLALLTAGRSSVWMPRNDISAPAVSSAIVEQNAKRMEKENRPAVIISSGSSTNSENEKTRKKEVEKVKNEFNSLPDAH